LLDVARVTSGKIELRSEALDLRALAERSLDALADAARTGNTRWRSTVRPCGFTAIPPAWSR